MRIQNEGWLTTVELWFVVVLCSGGEESIGLGGEVGRATVIATGKSCGRWLVVVDSQVVAAARGGERRRKKDGDRE